VCVPSCSQLAIHPNGRILALASSKGGAWLWRIGSGAPRPLGRVPSTGASLRAIAFSPDGRLLATAEEGGRIVLWDVVDATAPMRLGYLTTGSVTYALNGAWLAFGPGGRLIATAGPENAAALYDISDPRRPRRVVPLGGHEQSVSSVAFSPNGRMLATAGADQTTVLWDLRRPHDPHLTDRLSADLDVPSRVSFAPDGHTVATAAGQGQRVLLWETDFQRLSDQICSATEPMSRERWNHYFPGTEYRDPCPE
jgi:WD40 repeat protein